jgi:hypothetical protein
LKVVAVVSLVFAAGCASTATPDAPGANPAETVVGSVGPAADASAKEAAVASISSGRTSSMGADETEVHVTAPRTTSSLREDQPVGAYRQPEWTTERRFATARAYVLPCGQIELEQWMRTKAPRGESPEHRWQTEIGVGLGNRWQLDVYENYGNSYDKDRVDVKHETVQVEARYALADWGDLPWNPTLYGEYKFNHRKDDAVEGKLLLADDLGDGCHAAVNLFVEQEVGGEKEREIGASAGISWAVLDSQFSVGAEAKFEHVTVKHARKWHEGDNELLVGPSFQWRPTENTHVDFVPLCGVTKSDRRDPRYEVYLVLGWDFGPERGVSAPTSSRSK